MSKYPFPYTSVEAGQKDNWKKITNTGYTLQQVLSAGWYNLMNRKDRNLDQSALKEIQKNDPQFKELMERARQKVKDAKGIK